MMFSWLRKLSSALCLVVATGLSAVAGCAQLPTETHERVEAIVRGAEPEEPEKLSVMPGKINDTPKVAADALPAPKTKVLPISLDTVLRLAQDRNGEIELAREKVNESFVKHELAVKSWLPDLYVTTNYYRHEGGVQDFTGRLIHSSTGAYYFGLDLHSKFDIREYAYNKIRAEQGVWKSRGELAKLTSEKLLDASETYVDMLAALEGQLIAEDIEKKLDVLLRRAKDFVKAEPGLRFQMTPIEAELFAQRQIIRKLAAAARSASAKMKYLLGIDPYAELLPVDRKLVPITLVDAKLPQHVLIDRALTSGPGVNELHGLLALIEASNAQAANKWNRLMPIVEVDIGQGGLGAGPGADATWDNQLDMVFQLRWNLTARYTANEKQRMLQSQIRQVQLSYQNLRSHLTLGVQEARETILGRTDQIETGDKQIDKRLESYKLSKRRLDENAEGASLSEVLFAVRFLSLAEFNQLSAIRELNKAQLRMFVLLGHIPDKKDCDQVVAPPAASSHLINAQ